MVWKARNLISIITLHAVYPASETNNEDFKKEQNNFLRLVHCCKIRTVSLKPIFLVLIKKSVDTLSKSKIARQEHILMFVQS